MAGTGKRARNQRHGVERRPRAHRRPAAGGARHGHPAGNRAQNANQAGGERSGQREAVCGVEVCERGSLTV